MHSHNVVLDVATSADAGVLANLLELYIHEMSDAFPHLVIGADGRFGYRRLPLYWAEPENRFAFLIRCDARLAGFALVTRGSPITDDPSVLDLAEFFVLRRYRRSSVGRRAAALLWTRLPGKWLVRVSSGKIGAVEFWRDVITEFTGGTGVESERAGDAHPWRVYSFESGVQPSARQHLSR